MREIPPALAAMAAYRQFIVCKFVPSATRPGKTDKFPCDFRTGQVVSAHDPQYWTDAPTAIAYAATFGVGYGVGFVFTEADPFWFLDIDGCLIDGQWSPLAQQLCGLFQGAAVEVSQSGTGLHLFGCGTVPQHKSKNIGLGIEFYTSGRFVALTGAGAAGNVWTNHTQSLAILVQHYFAPDAGTDDAVWGDGPDPEWKGPENDADLLRRAMQSKSTASAFGNRASFADLWTANVDVLAKAYPDDARAYDESSADAALAQHLAFWTGKDCERIQRLMRQSALVRDKWDREDYLPRTILGAVSRQIDVLQDKAPEPPTIAALEPTIAADGTVSPVAVNDAELIRPTLTNGSGFVAVPDQLNVFKGCVYIQQMHRVLVPGGQLLKPEQFRVAYGGYQMPLDNANERASRDAWEVFTQSQAYRAPRADLPCFRPDLPPGTLVKKGGQVYTNTYWPVDVPRKVGDVTPFLTHLRKVLPNERDNMILLCYAAACVQHKGIKFQWAPLLQGVEGNGKTLFTRCVAEAVGQRYVHWPKASQISKNFNAWMQGKVFYGVEDIYVPGDRNEVFEILKPMITGDMMEIEYKGVDQISAEICGNFMFNSNHRDAIRKTTRDRRFCMLFSAQQEAADLARDGMTGEYFPRLYNWLKNEDGYAIVSELLHTMPIPDEFNPATGCQRAPTTSSTAAAIAANVGGIEQEILEAVAQGVPGFCGGWISSIQLDRLLERVGAHRKVTHNKRRDMLADMGFIPHPALSDGRVNNVVQPDNAKPRLFVSVTSEARHIQGAAEAARAYEQSNMHRAAMPFAHHHGR